MNQEPIRTCLERIGQALSTNNLRDLADCWEFPALMLSDEGPSRSPRRTRSRASLRVLPRAISRKGWWQPGPNWSGSSS